MRSLAAVALAIAVPSLTAAQAVKPRPIATAEVGGTVLSGRTLTPDGGCILHLRVKPLSDTYAPILDVWIPAPLAIATPSIGHWCTGIQDGDYLRLRANLDGWNCGPDLCGRVWSTSVVAHLRRIDRMLVPRETS